MLAPGGQWTGPASIEVADGRIVRVNGHASPGAAPGGTLTPGMLDLHNNGAFGVDFAVADGPAWRTVLGKLAERGVTAVQPTVITAPLPDILAALRRMTLAGDMLAGDPVARILGAHVEGPFLSPARRGAHQAEWLLDPTAAALDRLLGDPAARMLRMVTLAPERPHALAAIRRLTRAGIVVALGHSDATAAEALAATEAGATVVTHVFNAMRPLGHRDPALPGVALTEPRLWCCLIVDGQHVDPVACRLAFAAAGPRLVAVSDSVLVAGLPPGTELEFGGMPVRMDDAGLGRRPDGTISGAGIVLDEGVRRMVAAGIDPARVLHAVTEAPADAIGRPDLGRIAPGALADLVWWDDAWVPRRVWVGGVEVTAGGGPVVIHPAAGRGLDSLATEGVRPGLEDLDQRPVAETVHLLLAAERQAQSALARAEPQLAAAAESVAARMRQGGRLFYLGAGTPGRLATLDAAELAPTYSAPAGLVIPLLAGGSAALVQAAEGAEDDAPAAAAALDAHALQPGDAVVGIAASGRTPFVVGGLRHARAQGALTVAIVNNSGSPAAAAADWPVEILTGAEVIAGSTRMTAGTTQKIALNTLSTAVMVALGKTYGARMVDVRASNEKLRYRALRMVQDITGADARRSAAALAQADGRVKPAIVALLAGIDVGEAERRLAASGGFVRRAIEDAEPAG